MCRFQTTQDEGYIKIKKALNNMITTSTKKGGKLCSFCCYELGL